MISKIGLELSGAVWLYALNGIINKKNSPNIRLLDITLLNAEEYLP